MKLNCFFQFESIINGINTTTSISDSFEYTLPNRVPAISQCMILHLKPALTTLKIATTNK